VRVSTEARQKYFFVKISKKKVLKKTGTLVSLFALPRIRNTFFLKKIR
jgi:hypothetical protein